jgi:oligopeptide transport system substrate-binding protein
MTFMDLFITNGPNNDSDWSNAEYDKLIKEAQGTNDQKVRMPALHQAEKIIMEEAPIVPFAFRNKNSLIDPKLKGIYQSPLGHVFFTYAYWEK